MNYYTPTVRNTKAAFAFFRANPGAKVPMSWCSDYTEAEFRAFFMQCLHHKINSHLPPWQGRKYAISWQVETKRAARALNTPRLVIDWLPEHLKARFAHRLRNRDDY